MGTPISSIEFPGSPEEYLLRDHRCVDTETGGATSNDFGFVKLPAGTSLDANGRMNFDNIIGVATPTKLGLVKTGFEGTKYRFPVSVDENGDAYVELEQVIESLSSSGVYYPHGNNRWMIFDFSNPNHRSIKIKKGTKIRLDIKNAGETESRWFSADEDEFFDFAADINRFPNKNGENFYVYLVPDGENDVKLVISQNSTFPNDVDISYTANNSRKIGQFHTLCTAVGVDQVTKVAAAHGSVTVGEKYLVKNYKSNDEDGFYNFYNRTITGLTAYTVADVLTVSHPLAGFNAGDILPESIFCLSFRPKADPAGMVYDINTDLAADIYLQSGTGRLTESAFGRSIIVGREQLNHQDDMLQVGKRLLFQQEFTSVAIGSNQGTAANGSVENNNAGGHVDTEGARMISFIGCEDCCGFLWQWTCNVSGLATYDDGTIIDIYDGLGSLGKANGRIGGLFVGGSLINGSYCGARSLNSHHEIILSVMAPNGSARGASSIIRL